jgi:hypothetical protein
VNHEMASFSAFDPEYIAMSRLVKSLTLKCFVSAKIPDEEQRDETQKSSTLEIDHVARLDVLKYGYSSRTFQTLSTHFPRFRTSLGEKKWRDLGQSFADSDAFRAAQLGLLPIRFVNWLKQQNLSDQEGLSCQIDYAVFDIGVEDFYQFNRLDFNLLDEHSLVILRPTVRLITGKSFGYVVSRSPEEVFVQSASTQWIEILNRTKTAALCLLLSESFGTSEDFGLFLASALSYHWLAIV